MRVAAEARYTIVAVDTNVATLILDGQAFRVRPWNAVATLPALATAVTVAPTNDMREILRVRRSELAHRWLASTPPPRPCLRPKITNTVLEELKASKQVCLQYMCALYVETEDCSHLPILVKIRRCDLYKPLPTKYLYSMEVRDSECRCYVNS